MKHAYLIMAHNEFDILRLLISAIDDPRNDIYIHFDAKVRELPSLSTRNADLYILSDRIDVRWGDLSVVEAEFALYEAAYTEDKYGHYHLLSGVDLPLKSQDKIHEFFDRYPGKEFVGFYHGEDLGRSLDRKVRRIHLFPDSFRGAGRVFQSKRFVRSLFLKAQELVGYKRHRDIPFAKGTQWTSITQWLVKALLKDKERILRLYRNTFCADEIFVQTYLWNHPEHKCRVFDTVDEARGCMRHIGWRDGVLIDFEAKDLDELLSSKALFARKFNSRDMAFLYKIVDSL